MDLGQSERPDAHSLTYTRSQTSAGSSAKAERESVAGAGEQSKAGERKAGSESKMQKITSSVVIKLGIVSLNNKAVASASLSVP